MSPGVITRAINPGRYSPSQDPRTAAARLAIDVVGPPGPGGRAQSAGGWYSPAVAIWTPPPPDRLAR